MNKYKNRAFLVEHYIRCGQTMGQIAELFGVNSATIFYYLKKHGIKTRSKSEAILRERSSCSFGIARKTYQNKNWLKSIYLGKKKSTTEIGQYCGVSGRTISEWLKKFNVKARSASEAKIGRLNPQFGKKQSPKHIRRRTAAILAWYKTHVNPMKGKIRERSSNWKGGQCLKDGKRVLLYQPNNPQADCRGYVRRSRMIAEKALGRPLKRNEDVHHINGNPADDRNRNLLICGHSYHAFLEARIKELNWKPSGARL